MNEPSEGQSLLGQSETQMRKGMLVYCVLLLCKDGKVYSSEIIRRLHEAELIVVEGTLYPLLTRLKNNGLLTYNWVESTSGPPRKYYVLSPEGRKVLEQLDSTWAELSLAVATALEGRNLN